MTKRIKQAHYTWYELFCVFLAFFSIVLTIFMIIPLWPALTVGIASLSVVVFSFFIVVAFYLFSLYTTRVVKMIALTAIVLSVFSLVLPQVAFLQSAQQSGVKLSFNPVSYMTFSGSSDIKPSVTKSYKTVGKQKLVLSYYKPEKTEKNPVVVLLHGGAWRYGDHLETGQWPRALTEAGYAVISVEYRLSNDRYHSWGDTPADVHDAIRYIKSNAESFSIDPEQVHLLGQSAGGHLALLEAYRFESVQSVIALYAPIDLTLDYETSRDKTAELDFIGGPPKQFKERYESLSPLSYIDQKEPRTLIFQGTHDDLVHPDQASQLSEKLAVYNAYNEVVILPFTGHSFENQRGGFATQISTQRVLRFLKQ